MIKRESLFEYVDLMKKWEKRRYLVENIGFRKKLYTFGDIRKKILALTSVLKEKGIKKNDRVILWGESSPMWVVAFFSILGAEGVVVPIDQRSSKEFVNAIIEKTGSKLVICDKNGLDIGLNKIYFNDIKNLSGETQPISPPQTGSDDLAEIVFTSGTTSRPKGVMLTHKNILSNLLVLESSLERFNFLVRLITPFRIMCSVPYSHMFGQVTGIFIPIILGSTIYFPSELSPSILAEEIKKNRILTLIAVPRVMKMLADYVKTEFERRGKLDKLERKLEKLVKLPYPLRIPFLLDIHGFLGFCFWSFICGGAALDNQTHEFWRRAVYAIFQGYGLTETAPIVTMFSPFHHRRDSVGKPFPTQQIKLGPDGEILIKGENVTPGYFGDLESTNLAFQNGWLKTGDIGEIDDKGHIIIKGRKKEVIVTSDGTNVYPEDIENAFLNTEGVRDCVVFGIKSNGGEEPVAVLLLKPETDPERVLLEANKKLQHHQRVSKIYIWEEEDFPRTPTMKPVIYEIKRKVIEKLDKEKEVSETGDSLIRRILYKTTDENLTLGEGFGLDSLDIIEVACELEEKLGVKIDESLLTPDLTISELKRIISKPAKVPPLKIPTWTFSRLITPFRRLIMDFIILPSFRVFLKVKSRGIENLPRSKEPILLASNHTSDLDPVAILLALPIKYRELIAPAMGLNRFALYFRRYGRVVDEQKAVNEYTTSNRKVTPEKRRHFTVGIKGLLQIIGFNIITFLFRTFPLPQTLAYRPSLSFCGELADRGNWILIFPEGEVSKTGKIEKFKKGVAYIAQKTSLPVFPVGIKGLEEKILKNLRLLKRRTVTVSFGQPLTFSGESYEEFIDKLRERVMNLF